MKLNSERESARNQEKAKTEKMLRTIEKIEFENTMQVHIQETSSSEASSKFGHANANLNHYHYSFLPEIDSFLGAKNIEKFAFA